MKAIQFKQPELYQTLLPKYKLIKNKKNSSNLTIGASLLVGGSILVYSYISDDNNYDPNMQAGRPNKNERVRPLGLGIMALGGILGLLMAPKDRDYIDFINLNNRNTTKDKMKIKVGYNYNMNRCLELSLKLNF
jgi:hypothetical protein